MARCKLSVACGCHILAGSQEWAPGVAPSARCMHSVQMNRFSTAAWSCAYPFMYGYSWCQQ